MALTTEVEVLTLVISRVGITSCPAVLMFPVSVLMSATDLVRSSATRLRTRAHDWTPPVSLKDPE